MVNDYKNLLAYAENPTKGIINLKDQENLNKMGKKEKADKSGEYSYTKNHDK